MDSSTSPSRPAGVDRRDAVEVAGRTLSSSELAVAAAATAARIGGARTVAVDATASLETVVAVLSGLVAGVPVVPVPPDAGVAERAHILADSGAELLLCAPDRVPEPAGIPAVPVDVRQRSAATWPAPPGERTALIMYTSGTTGPPKGARISHAAIAAGLDALADAWEWTDADLVVHGLPLFHVHGLVLGVLGPLRFGSRLRHTGRPTPAAYAAAGGTLYFGVPTVWQRVCDDPGSARALSTARLLVSGSAALPAVVFERLRALTGHRPVERYGMTETLITVSGRADGERRPGAVGTPLRGVDTRLVDDAGRVLARADAVVGELQVRGPMLFSGYHDRPRATAASHTADGWFRTGDLATIGPDGWHRIVGRASTDLIKSGGYRIGAGEVESALLAHPAVREAAVVGTPHPDLGEQVTAYVVADGASESELIEFVAGLIAAHKRPRAVRLVAELPRNAMGKVLKQVLIAAD